MSTSDTILALAWLAAFMIMLLWANWGEMP